MQNVAEQIFQKVSPLPEPLALEVLDFVNFITYQHQDTDLIKSQSLSMTKLWDNPSDEVWNDL